MKTYPFDYNYIEEYNIESYKNIILSHLHYLNRVVKDLDLMSKSHTCIANELVAHWSFLLQYLKAIWDVEKKTINSRTILLLLVTDQWYVQNGYTSVHFFLLIYLDFCLFLLADTLLKCILLIKKQFLLINKY